MLVLVSQVAMARARGGHTTRFLMPMGAVSTLEIVPDWLVLQRFSSVERVTGIEPALSAWEWKLCPPERTENRVRSAPM